jgi:hypothetical protein
VRSSFSLKKIATLSQRFPKGIRAIRLPTSGALRSISRIQLRRAQSHARQPKPPIPLRVHGSRNRCNTDSEVMNGPGPGPALGITISPSRSKRTTVTQSARAASSSPAGSQRPPARPGHNPGPIPGPPATAGSCTGICPHVRCGTARCCHHRAGAPPPPAHRRVACRVGWGETVGRCHWDPPLDSMHTARHAPPHGREDVGEEN